MTIKENFDIHDIDNEFIQYGKRIIGKVARPVESEPVTDNIKIQGRKTIKYQGWFLTYLS